MNIVRILIILIICVLVPVFFINLIVRSTKESNTDLRSRAADENILVSRNVPVRASAVLSETESKAQFAVDGSEGTNWNSGNPAPQWIELDLGSEKSLSMIRMKINQTPNGPTVHEIYGGLTTNPGKLMVTLAGDTVQNQWLQADPSAAAADFSSPVRFIRIRTSKSPSWISWSEIEVYAKNPGGGANPPAGGGSADKILGIRQLPRSKNAEIYNVKTGIREYLRGYNYTHIIEARSGSTTGLANMMFDPQYNLHGKFVDDMAALKAKGYNSVRVFVNNSRPYSDESVTDKAFWDQFIDLLRVAAENGIYVIASTDNLYNKYLRGEPYNSEYYCVKEKAENPEPDICSYNWPILDRNGVLSYKNYLTEFITYLKSKGAPTQYMIYNVSNETFFDKTKRPFCNDPLNDTREGCQTPFTGKIMAANGREYSMPGDAENLQREGLQYQIDEMVATVKRFDPGALTSVQYVPPVVWQNNPSVGISTDTVRNIVENAAVDIITLSYYPSLYNLPKIGDAMASIGYVPTKGYRKAFVIMEMGYLGTIPNPTQNVTKQQACEGFKKIIYDSSCNYNFSGWNIWTYDAVAEGWHTGTENGNYILDRLAPVRFPSSCRDLQRSVLRSRRFMKCE